MYLYSTPNWPVFHHLSLSFRLFFACDDDDNTVSRRRMRLRLLFNRRRTSFLILEKEAFMPVKAGDDLSFFGEERKYI
jgi:hypothetical protein